MHASAKNSGVHEDLTEFVYSFTMGLICRKRSIVPTNRCFSATCDNPAILDLKGPRHGRLSPPPILTTFRLVQAPALWLEWTSIAIRDLRCTTSIPFHRIQRTPPMSHVHRTTRIFSAQHLIIWSTNTFLMCSPLNTRFLRSIRSTLPPSGTTDTSYPR